MQTCLMLFILTLPSAYKAYEQIKAIEIPIEDNPNLAVSSSTRIGTLKAYETLLPTPEENHVGPVEASSAGDQTASPRKPFHRFFTFTAVDHGDHNETLDFEEADESGNEPKDYDVVFANIPAPQDDAVVKTVASSVAKQQTVVNVLSDNVDTNHAYDALKSSDIKPEKPRVVYIKYQKPEEANALQGKIQDQYRAIPGSAFNYGQPVAPVLSIAQSLALFHPLGIYRYYGRYGVWPLSVPALGIPNYYVPALF